VECAEWRVRGYVAPVWRAAQLKEALRMGKFDRVRLVLTDFSRSMDPKVLELWLGRDDLIIICVTIYKIGIGRCHSREFLYWASRLIVSSAIC
jgi:hypothetical protein